MKQKLFLLIFLLLVSISLDAQTRLKGRIVNSAGGEAVENALVSIRNYSFSVKTKVSGVFEFIDIPADVSGGVIIIEVKCEGFAYREFTLERPNASIEYKF